MTKLEALLIEFAKAPPNDRDMLDRLAAAIQEERDNLVMAA